MAWELATHALEDLFRRDVGRPRRYTRHFHRRRTHLAYAIRAAERSRASLTRRTAGGACSQTPADSANRRARANAIPFDRMLIAQAQAEAIPILSNDDVFEVYKVPRVCSQRARRRIDATPEAQGLLSCRPELY
jgi:hypothetical protein